MRKVVAGLFTSLDGMVDSPESSFFSYTNKEVTEWIAEGIAQADAILFGPRTYQLLAESWKDHSLWRDQSGDDLMADFMNNTPKYVVSNKPMGELEWQPGTQIRGNLAEELGKLKTQPGKNIQIPGSPRLVRSLLCVGLLDELGLIICPVVVGSGMRLLDEITSRVNLKLIDLRAFSNGVLAVRYQPLRAGDQAVGLSPQFPSAAART